MYTSVLAVVFGQALFYQSKRVAWYGAFLFVCMHLSLVFYEERDLRVRLTESTKNFAGSDQDGCRDSRVKFHPAYIL